MDKQQLEAIRARDQSRVAAYGSLAAENAALRTQLAEATAAWHDRDTRLLTMEARLAEQDMQLKSYSVLRRAVNESTNECGPDCDDHGHADGCPALNPSSWLEDQQRRIETLKARLAEAEAALTALVPMPEAREYFAKYAPDSAP